MYLPDLFLVTIVYGNYMYINANQKAFGICCNQAILFTFKKRWGGGDGTGRDGTGRDTTTEVRKNLFIF